MREPEAAQYLQVNPRTLYRYRKSGKLAYRAVPTRGRSVIEYEAGDIEALKQELERERALSVKAVPAAKSVPVRVSFGLAPRDYQELAQEAAKYEMKVGEYARQLVREGLESRFQAEAQELRVEMKRQNASIEAVRQDFAAGFEAVLEFAGLSPSEAKTWVATNLR